MIWIEEISRKWKRDGDWRTLGLRRGMLRIQFRPQPALDCAFKHQRATRDGDHQHDETREHACPTVEPQKSASQIHAPNSRSAPASASRTRCTKRSIARACDAPVGEL